MGVTRGPALLPTTPVGTALRGACWLQRSNRQITGTKVIEKHLKLKIAFSAAYVAWLLRRSVGFSYRMQDARNNLLY